ncbi:serine hydrolase FSH [Xylariaceae sp. FL1651]|nr:serine hydrolase FSH [Xylariaceae sp. FL1651]
MMRILCLHGRNQSGRIFEAHLEPAIKVFQGSESRVSFDFTDGPICCAELSADGQPVYNFYAAPVIAEIRNAHEWLARKLDVDGPYDGVIAFSQGAALVSSYLLYQQWYEHEQAPPFKFAGFMSGSIPLDVLKSLGAQVSRAAERVVEETELRRQGVLGPLPSHVSRARLAIFNSDDCFGLNLNKMPLELKIRVPTIHVWGQRDPEFPASIHLAGLCDPYIRKMHTHGDAHEVPQGVEDVSQLAQLILWCMQRAVWPGQSQI